MASSGQLSPEMAAENKGPAILAACYTVEAIASFFVAARLFVRGRMMGKWQLDDWLIIVSMVCGPHCRRAPKSTRITLTDTYI